jgi:hypothetical protein
LRDYRFQGCWDLLPSSFRINRQTANITHRPMSTAKATPAQCIGHSFAAKPLRPSVRRVTRTVRGARSSKRKERLRRLSAHRVKHADHCYDKHGRDDNRRNHARFSELKIVVVPMIHGVDAPFPDWPSKLSARPFVRQTGRYSARLR